MTRVFPKPQGFRAPSSFVCLTLAGMMLEGVTLAGLTHGGVPLAGLTLEGVPLEGMPSYEMSEECMGGRSDLEAER